jgi:hypothetical protein
MWFVLVAFLSSASAKASCSHLVRRAAASSTTTLARNFVSLAKCSKQEAEASFDSLLPRAKNAEALVALSMAGIETDVWNPVWRVLSHEALDYDMRDQVAQAIGGKCSENPKVVTFLKGAYLGAIRDLEFQQWDDALVACSDAGWATWLNQQAENPPNSVFDDKYNALLSVIGKRLGPDALPIYAKAAIKGANQGPFDAILMQMEASVQPGIGEPIAPENKTRLEAALVEIASNVPKDKARSVADRLANAGATAAAASLLPMVYPNLIDESGGFLYGAAGIERADCEGTKTVVLHVARVEESGTRWIILDDVRSPLRAMKPRLGKCTTEGSEWGVSTTPEPVASSKDVDAWVDTLEKQWEGKGYDVSVRKEKTISLD